MPTTTSLVVFAEPEHDRPAGDLDRDGHACVGDGNRDLQGRRDDAVQRGRRWQAESPPARPRSRTSGAHAITAVFGGSAALGASTSAVLVQTVNDQRVKTVETIGTFISRRNDLIAANEPDANRQIDRS